MLNSPESIQQRTTTDIVFDQLHQDIVTLRILPNSRISEAEIAARLGVSRQPVRDAFNRLGNLGLLKIRPQRPTIVRGFSLTEIANARFVRMAVELEIIRDACSIWNDECAEELEANLNDQRAAIASGRTADFRDLDYQFHQIICVFAGHPMAYQTILQCKQKVDRLCVLSLEHDDEASAVLADHEEIAAALHEKTLDSALFLTRRHLSRLDDTIKTIHDTHSEYFE